MNWTDERGNAADQQLASLIRSERERRFLSQGKLAELSGVDRRRISSYERRQREPSLREAERVLAGMGLQLRLETEPLSSDLDARIDELSTLSTDERLARVPFLIPQLMQWLAAGEPVIEGATAALIQGAPLEPKALDLCVDTAHLDAFAEAMLRFPPARWNERWEDYGVDNPDPRRPGAMRWRTHLGPITLRVVDELPASLTVIADGAAVPIRPLADVEVVDPAVAELLRRFRQRPRG